MFPPYCLTMLKTQEANKMFNRSSIKKYRDELIFIGLSLLVIFVISLLSE